MKRLSLHLILLIVGLISCTPGQRENDSDVTFGIYRVTEPSQVHGFVIDSLKAAGMQPEVNAERKILGYLPVETSFDPSFFSNDSIKLMESYFTVGKDSGYRAIIVVNKVPGMVLSDIKKVKPEGNAVYIYFTGKGARKWAEFTKKHIGESAAIAINGQVYTMPRINAEIRNGSALIPGLKDEETASNIADELNKGMSNKK